MRIATLSLLVLLCAAANAAEKPGVPAQAAEKSGVWIASGPSGGTYRRVYANNFQKRLRSYDVFHRMTTGSGENLELLVSGQADIAFVQADIYAEQLRKEPGRLEDVLLIGEIATECVYIAYRRGGAVESLAQLGELVDGRLAKIAVGPAAGGASGTWSHLATLDPALADVVVDHGGDTLALNQLAAGVYEAMIWVTDPNNLSHKLLVAVRANDKLGLMPIDDPKFVESLPGGTTIYERREVALEEGGWRPDKLETVCTGALVLARKDSDPEFIKKLSDVVSMYPR